MQNSDLKNWYKSSFESIKGKPAPDVWHAIESEIPNGRSNLFRQFIFVLLPALVIGGVWFGWPSVSQDYMPRVTAFSSSSHLANLIKHTHSRQLYSPHLASSSYVPTVVNRKNTRSTPQLSADNSATSQKAVNHRFKTLLTEKESQLNSAYIFKAPLIETMNPISVVGLPRPEEAPLNHTANYFGASFRVSSVNMLNNSFRKAASSETLTVNELYVKPSYSLLFGKHLRKSMFLELSAAKVDLGQAISTYDEGAFTTRRESLNYLGVGVGIVNYCSSNAKITPYYGANIEGRFLLKSNTSNQTYEFSKMDFAFGIKGGFSYHIKQLTLSTGLMSSISLANTIGGNSAGGFYSSRNMAAGLEFMITRSL
jgi:hypothetical protein